jgi:hypothetical protein
MKERTFFGTSTANKSGLTKLKAGRRLKYGAKRAGEYVLILFKAK